jgi:lipopolysaccharide transport system ATP-binding protein
MSSVSAVGLGKGFRRYGRPLDRALEWFRGGLRHEMFWAVRDVSFDLPGGATLGIVGDNGAGKTSLLAMLAGASTPTVGRLTTAGRVGSILELGAGLHPAFTGRENVFLAGQAMGLNRREIEDRLSEIVDFSELGEFIDQPSRTYSSGMFLRLAFSIATAVRPDILVIDEALAVGDQRFQAKCTERIDGFVRDGGTLMFCSHNLYQVRRLCDRTLWLEGGMVQQIGPSAEVCDAYMDRSRGRALAGGMGVSSGENPLLSVTRVEFVGGDGERAENLRTGDAATLRVWLKRAPGADVLPAVAVGVVRGDGLVCHCASSDESGVEPAGTSNGEFYISMSFRELALLGGRYHFNVAAIDGRRPLVLLDVREGEAPFSVTNPGTDWGVSRLPHIWSNTLPGGGDGSAEGNRA